MLSVSNDLFAPTEVAKPLHFNSGIRSAEGGANAQDEERFFLRLLDPLVGQMYYN